jgi:AcrR family transcriptional regulator
VTDSKDSVGEVPARLLAAATSNYVNGGSFSVRQIADAAGVNHGQIHHYFGGKPELKRAMLERLSEDLLRSIEDATEASSPGVDDFAARAVQALTEDPSFARALGRHLIEDSDVAQRKFPVIAKLRARANAADSERATFHLATGLATSLGWALFQPWIQQALELSDRETQEITASHVEQVSGGETLPPKDR